ncbi:MAG: decaprenyl-phosphate phosphoribosyltransferase [Bacteroidales bacterium]|nr:decaprenyl-phosphate phosphoribosyltransferase [Bacteroidales bacterium]
MRPWQWYKNLILFAGIVFSMNLMDLELWFTAISAFVLFCILSGSEYIINDIIDLKKDRVHPVKRNRPIASGELKIPPALLFAVLLIVCAGVGSWLINIRFFAVSIIYFFLIILYSLIFKYIIVVDVLIVSISFVIRAVAGCVAIDVFISPWLIICTFLLALFLALGKRQHELMLLGDEAKNHRKILGGYTTRMLDQMVSITTGALITSYSMYTFLVNDYYMMFTIPFVVYGIFRYLFLIHVRNVGGEPEMLFKDKGMLVCMLLWGVLVVGVLYGVFDIAMRFVREIG